MYIYRYTYTPDRAHSFYRHSVRHRLWEQVNFDHIPPLYPVPSRLASLYSAPVPKDKQTI